MNNSTIDKSPNENQKSIAISAESSQKNQQTAVTIKEKKEEASLTQSTLK